MNFLRRFSICQRVLYGLVVLSLLGCGLGLAGAQRLKANADALQQLSAQIDPARSNPALPGQLDALRQTNDQAALLIALLAGVLGLAGAVGGYAVRASIKQPIERTIQAIIAMGKGDLASKVSSPGRDEISWMNAELNGMRKKLNAMVGTVRASSESVLNAAAEIAQGNSDLSNRTEDQASELQQTSSVMDRVAATAKENAVTAGTATQLVAEANSVATHGGGLMRSVVERMGDINTSAKRIAEIIQVIDGIAFQTNILALNAAVEAARAGEHGRGFAVVASEVRGLAQRCAGAAKEVKLLINDSAVKVDAGFKLVDEAGMTMERIVRGVDKVSRLVADMARAESAQIDGISQIHQSISQMDEMTQRNAALVEQAAAAALSLQSQSQQLTASVGVFRIA